MSLRAALATSPPATWKVMVKKPHGKGRREEGALLCRRGHNLPEQGNGHGGRVTAPTDGRQAKKEHHVVFNVVYMP